MKDGSTRKQAEPNVILKINQNWYRRLMEAEQTARYDVPQCKKVSRNSMPFFLCPSLILTQRLGKC